MAVYDAECDKCGTQTEYVCSIADMTKKLPRCCGQKMKRVILTAPQVGAMTWTSHKAVMVNGKLIESGDQYKRMMKQGNFMPHSEAVQEVAKKKAREKVEHTKRLDKAIEKAIKAS